MNAEKKSLSDEISTLKSIIAAKTELLDESLSQLTTQTQRTEDDKKLLRDELEQAKNLYTMQETPFWKARFDSQT